MATIISTKTSGVGGLSVTGDASGILQLASADGTTALTINASQNVGIGTASPTTKLNIVDASATVNVQLESGSVRGQYFASTSASGVYLGSSSAHPLVFRTDTTERMRIDSSGNLLVGTTTSPSGTGQISCAKGVTGTPAFSAYNSVATTVVNGASGTQVALQTELFDTANCFDTSTWKFTPNVAGYYQINGVVSFADAPITASAIQAYISKNGTDATSAVALSCVGGNTIYVQILTSVLVYLNGSSDYVCLVAYQNQGSTRTTQTGVSKTYFNGFLARGA